MSERANPQSTRDIWIGSIGGGFGGTAGVWGGIALAERVAQPGSILAILLTLAMAGLSAGAMALALRALLRRRAA